MSEPTPPGETPSGDDVLIEADTGGTGRVPFVPSDNTTLTAVVAGLAEAGFTGHLTPHAGGVLRCSHCEAESPAAEFEVAAVRRLEGASDPDEMVSVVAATCPRCASRGVAVLGFGPAASDVDADVMVALVTPTTEV